jgi:hypothetical protein
MAWKKGPLAALAVCPAFRGLAGVGLVAGGAACNLQAAGATPPPPHPAGGLR